LRTAKQEAIQTVKSRGWISQPNNKKSVIARAKPEANQKNKEKNRLLPASFLAVRNDEQTKLNNE
jgi:hypothetical protein